MDVKGIFSTMELSDNEKDVYAEYLQHSMNTPILEFVRYLLGDEYLKFIDILSGTTLKIPSSRTLERDLEFVRIYTFVFKRGFSDESFKTACRSFGKTIITIRRAVMKVAKTLGVGDTLEGDALNNYNLFILGMEEIEKNKKCCDSEEPEECGCIETMDFSDEPEDEEIDLKDLICIRKIV